LKEPVWVNLDAVLIFHEEHLLEFGGASGIRERGAIESALTRPQNLFAYGQPDLFDLAAAYTAGLSQNHGFVDGNKRTAFLTGLVFLAENGYNVIAEQAEVIAAMLELADHQLDEAGYAQWLRDHTVSHPNLNLIPHAAEDLHRSRG
jgi:death-on-curing protein